MHPQNAYVIRNLANAGRSVDGVADWFVELMLAMEVPEQARPYGFELKAATIEGARFAVVAHHQEFACFYGHVVVAETLFGQFDLVALTRDRKLGETVYKFRVSADALLFPDGSFIHQHLVSQQEYAAVRHAVVHHLMGGIQGRLPREPVA